MRAFVTKHQISIFFVLTFAISWFPWYAGIAPVLLSDSSLVAAREGTHLPTIAPTLYGTVLAVQVAGAIILTVVTRGKLGQAAVTPVGIEPQADLLVN